jgi:hypothetical protein
MPQVHPRRCQGVRLHRTVQRVSRYFSLKVESLTGLSLASGSAVLGVSARPSRRMKSVISTPSGNTSRPRSRPGTRSPCPR